MRIGIVGAGIAGLSCAEGLTAQGHDVMLFDKGRGPGGRMSTRRLETPGGVAAFDHGAQFFTLRDNGFRVQVDRWIADGVVASWPAAGSDAYVGVPAMNAPVRTLAGRHAVHWSALVDAVVPHENGWRLSIGEQDHHVDLAVIAVPAEQAAALLASGAADLAALAGTSVSAPCWTAMAAFAEPVAAGRDCWAASDGGDGGDGVDGVVGWAARNSAKPGRTGPESWVVQATAEWSRRHLDADRDAVAADLVTALAGLLDVDLPARIGVAAHLWRFARCAPADPARFGHGAVLDPARRLGLCGDWLIGPRVESAWLSGARLAERIAAEC